jgi:hypothetical protein
VDTLLAAEFVKRDPAIAVFVLVLDDDGDEVRLVVRRKNGF